MKNKNKFLLMLMSVFFMMSQSIFASASVDPPSTNDPSLFITHWVTTDGSITIPTIGAGYNYDISWMNLSDSSGSSLSGQNGDVTISGLQNGATYEIAISGDFPRIYFNNSGDKDKIIAVTQWGDIEWSSMNRAFAGATNLDILANDTPDLSNVMDMYYMFRGAESLTGTQGNWNWDTESVTNMSAVFLGALNFNGDITGWNTTNATNMASMFADAVNFNQNIGNWNTGNVKSMKTMFRNAQSFSQELGDWDLNSLTNAIGMFNVTSGQGMDCYSFTSTLSGWAANPNTPNNIVLGAEYRTVFTTTDVNYLENIKGWTILGHDGSCEVDDSHLFKTEWITYDGTITIPTIGNGYNYSVVWTNLSDLSSSTATEITGDYTITGLQNGVTYEVAIAGIFPRIYFNDSGDKEKLMTI